MKPRWNDYRGYPGCPCQGCSERNLGCHSKCEKYISWKDASDAINEERKRQECTARDFWGVFNESGGFANSHNYAAIRRRK